MCFSSVPVAAAQLFLWLTFALGLMLYVPAAIAVALIERPPVGLRELTFVLVSGGLHLGYFLLLQRGCRAGDLSLVYPLARGTGPALATVAAILESAACAGGANLRVERIRVKQHCVATSSAGDEGHRNTSAHCRRVTAAEAPCGAAAIRGPKPRSSSGRD
jgi:hypothetical protein